MGLWKNGNEVPADEAETKEIAMLRRIYGNRVSTKLFWTVIPLLVGFQVHGAISYVNNLKEIHRVETDLNKGMEEVHARIVEITGILSDQKAIQSEQKELLAKLIEVQSKRESKEEK